MAGGQLQSLAQGLGQQQYQAPQQPNPYAGAGRFMGGMDLQYQPFRPQTYVPQQTSPIMGLFNQIQASQAAAAARNAYTPAFDAGPGSGSPGAGGSGTTGLGTGTGQGDGTTSSPGIGESGVSGGGQAPGEAPGADGGGGGGGGK